MDRSVWWSWDAVSHHRSVWTAHPPMPIGIDPLVACWPIAPWLECGWRLRFDSRQIQPMPAKWLRQRFRSKRIASAALSFGILKVVCCLDFQTWRLLYSTAFGLSLFSSFPNFKNKRTSLFTITSAMIVPTIIPRMAVITAPPGSFSART